MTASTTAEVAFEETTRGRLTKGARADVSIFSVDLMTSPVEAIPRGRALATLVNGQIAYRAPGW